MHVYKPVPELSEQDKTFVLFCALCSERDHVKYGCLALHVTEGLLQEKQIHQVVSRNAHSFYSFVFWYLYIKWLSHLVAYLLHF